MNSSDPQVVTASDIDDAALDAFLRRFFATHHCDFLLHHGAWWHRGQQHRLVALVDDTIAGYGSVVPAPCRLDGETYLAHWWVDLVVDPKFRGRGLQTRMDRRVREGAQILLGFPNALAAGIHRKHGWGVSEEHRILLLPFQPTRLRPVSRAASIRGIVLRTAARLAHPLGRHLRRRATRHQPSSAHQIEEPHPETLSEIFERHHATDVTTTSRDAEYLQWRYFDAPYHDELAFFVAGDPSPRVAAITRSRHTGRGLVVKLLDLFGDLKDTTSVADLLGLVAQQAARNQAVELSAFATLPHLFPVFRAAGFVLSTTGRSCWHSADPAIMELLNRHPSHWAFGDSDQEEPA